MKIEALILDFGEVLVHRQTDAALESLARLAGLPLDEFSRRYWTNRTDYEGGLSAREYWQRVLGRGALATRGIDHVLRDLIRFNLAHYPFCDYYCIPIRGVGFSLWLSAGARRFGGDAPGPVEVGQQVAPGTNLARVANPRRLKAEVKIAETLAKDIQIGQKAHIDTRNGIVDGLAARIDPSVQNGTITVDVALTGDLPKGAVPDLSVDGTIELERMADVLYVGRPAFGQEQSIVGLFKLQPDGRATRLQVKLGRSSVNAVEIISGLNVGDQVVLSDMSAWDAFDRVRLQ
jgi:hypothetical protein